MRALHFVVPRDSCATHMFLCLYRSDRDALFREHWQDWAAWRTGWIYQHGDWRYQS